MKPSNNRRLGCALQILLDFKPYYGRNDEDLRFSLADGRQEGGNYSKNI